MECDFINMLYHGCIFNLMYTSVDFINKLGNAGVYYELLRAHLDYNHPINHKVMFCDISSLSFEDATYMFWSCGGFTFGIKYYEIYVAKTPISGSCRISHFL
jgi:hypothetical protein